MIIAHGPAGYLCGRLLSQTLFRGVIRSQNSYTFHRVFIFAGILGGIFPDFDFFYQILFDSGRTPHHMYLTHLPIIWLSIWLLCLLGGLWLKQRTFLAITSVFCFSALVHLVFDTLTGQIYWLAPFSTIGFNVFKIADRHFWWVRNYTGHWTFFIELFIIAIALFEYLRVRGTFAYLADHIQRNRRRGISLPLTACTLGMCFLLIAGSIKFDLSHRIVHKAKQLKHQIVRMANLS